MPARPDFLLLTPSTVPTRLPAAEAERPGSPAVPRSFHEVDIMVSRRSWWRRTLQRFWKAPRHPYRRWPQRSAGLLIEDLEDRTLLSAVVFTGRNITWNGFGATMGPNQPDMHVDGSGMLILTDLSGEAISLTGAPEIG